MCLLSDVLYNLMFCTLMCFHAKFFLLFMQLKNVVKMSFIANLPIKFDVGLNGIIINITFDNVI